MSELHLYSFGTSQPGRSITAFLKLSAIPYEYHPVNLMKGEHLTEEFIKLNPFQSIPVIVHGDYNL